MATTSVHIERRDIHLATCRARRQQLVCSTCCELIERADRAIRASAPVMAAA
jgi:hypothetical protein